MSATIKDIREETGLSLATISKYLNGGNVLPKNKELIDRAVEKLHYQVNELARSLVTNRTWTIGVSVYNIAQIFNGTILSELGRSLRSRGYGMMIYDAAENRKSEKHNIQYLLNKKVDGIIVIPIADNSDFLKPAFQAEVPVVVVDRELEGKKTDCVILDNRAAAKEAVRYFLSCGHKKIAMISSKVEYTGRERFFGYREAMQEAGIPVCESYLQMGIHTVSFGYQSMKKLMALPDPPTAVLMSNYDLNLGAVMAVNEQGHLCPEAFSLIGFDDLLLPHIVEPRLTVMEQPMAKLSENAVDLLLRRIEERRETGRLSGETKRIVLPARLIQGNSVRKIK